MVNSFRNLLERTNELRNDLVDSLDAMLAKENTKIHLGNPLLATDNDSYIIAVKKSTDNTFYLVYETDSGEYEQSIYDCGESHDTLLHLLSEMYNVHNKLEIL